MVTGRTHRMTEMIARLAPGATVQQARAEVATITSRVHAEFPEAYDAASGYHVTLTPFQEVLGAEGAAHALAAHGRRGVRAHHRLRQRREPHAHARRAARARARGARRARRRHRRGCAGCCSPRICCSRCSAAVLGLVLAFGGVRMLIGFRGAVQPARRRDPRSTAWCSRSRSVLAIVVAVLLSFAPTLAQERTLGAALAAGGRARRPAARAPATAAGAGRRAGRRVGHPAHRRGTA